MQGYFATGGAIQGVAYGMISFLRGYNEWHILLPCEVAQCDWYHHHMLNYAFRTGGMTMSDIAISSWCSTKRQGDTSESVVFYFLLLGVWDRCLFACVGLLKKKWVGQVALRSPINMRLTLLSSGRPRPLKNWFLPWVHGALFWSAPSSIEIPNYGFLATGSPRLTSFYAPLSPAKLPVSYPFFPILALHRFWPHRLLPPTASV